MSDKEQWSSSEESDREERRETRKKRKKKNHNHDRSKHKPKREQEDEAPKLDIEVEEMSIDDLADVYHLGERIYATQPDLYRTWDEFEVINYYNADSDYCIVAKVENSIVGFAMGTIIEKTNSPWKYGYLAWIGTDPEHQRKGVATSLFDRFHEMMVAEGVRMLLADTNGENVPAIHYLKKMGFGHRQDHVYLSLLLPQDGAEKPAQPKPEPKPMILGDEIPKIERLDEARKPTRKSPRTKAPAKQETKPKKKGGKGSRSKKNGSAPNSTSGSPASSSGSLSSEASNHADDITLEKAQAVLTHVASAQQHHHKPGEDVNMTVDSSTNGGAEAKAEVPPEPKKVEVNIRPMRIEDLSKVFHLGEKIFTSKFINLYRTWNQFEVVDLYNGDSEYCLVADVGGEVAGFSMGYLIIKHLSGWRYGYLVWLGVSPDFQRMGIASKLFNHFKQMMMEKGARMMLVDTQADNESAVQFFEKAGFGHPQNHMYLSMNIAKDVKDMKEAEEQAKLTMKKKPLQPPRVPRGLLSARSVGGHNL